MKYVPAKVVVEVLSWVDGLETDKRLFCGLSSSRLLPEERPSSSYRLAAILLLGALRRHNVPGSQKATLDLPG